MRVGWLRAQYPSWPGLSRPSTSYFAISEDVDARHKAGHDEERIAICSPPRPMAELLPSKIKAAGRKLHGRNHVDFTGSPGRRWTLRGPRRAVVAADA